MSKLSVECTECGNAALVPEGGDHRPLWAAGWRWIGSVSLFSCPACPPVVVERDGQHQRGPGQRADAI